MKPEQLVKLAEAMGYKGMVFPHKDGGMFVGAFNDESITPFVFEPHKDRAQAMEVLEWMVKYYSHPWDKVESVFYHTDGITFVEGITLAALELLELSDG